MPHRTVDPVDQVDIEFAHVHGEFAHTIDQAGAIRFGTLPRRSAPISLAFCVRFQAATAC